MALSDLNSAQLNLIGDLLFECEKRNVRFWLFGGWGIDALLGRITREHSDIDILVPDGSQVVLRSILEAIGGETCTNGTGWHYKKNDIGIDIGFLLTQADGTVVSDTDFSDPNVFPWPENSFPVECNGILNGVHCRAISWEAQYVAKAGYKNAFPDTTPREKDETDLEIIANHVSLDRRKQLEEIVFRGIPREQTILAEKLKSEADLLLMKSGLTELLSKYGEVVLTGSYRYGLMTRREIDLNVANPDAGRELARHIVSDLIEHGFGKGISFDDYLQFPYPDLPTGIYIDLKRSFGDGFWRVDIWNLAEVTAEMMAFDETMFQITESQRNSILQIKHWRDTNGLKIESRAIYQVVLSGKAYNIESFRQLVE